MNGTRERLIAATRHCVAERGIAGTTSRSITTEAGANLAAITYHFGSKEALITETLLSDVREWLRPALATFAGDADPEARSLAGIQQLLESYEAHRDLAPVLLEALVRAPRTPNLHASVLEMWDELRSGLAHNLSHMITSGDLPGWIDPDVMATLFIAVAQGLVMQVTLDPDGPEITALAAQFALLLLAARVPNTEEP